MLAAASSRSDRALESVKLVLRLESKSLKYPSTLKSYFRDVIQQTVELLEKPAEVTSRAMPEAVSLAVKMSSDDQLRELIEGLLTDDNISSDQAEKVLSSLETSLDPISEFTHFSKEIYAAI